MKRIEKYFPELTEVQRQQLIELLPIYQEWNAKINVISRKDMDYFYEKHVLHSMAIAKVLSFSKGMKVMDLGTGGGFPGLPLAILFPEVQFHLVDSIGKKLKVVDAVREQLQLKNVTTEHNRAEKIKHSPFDLVVTRAVASLKKLGRWSKPLLKKDNEAALICLKGGELAEEISESGYRPHVYHLKDYFQEDFYKTKKLLLIKP